MSSNPIIISNLLAVQDGLKVLHNIDNQHYQYVDKPAFSSTIGSHFRHIIEHYHCFLQAAPDNALCYDSRKRDASLEESREAAIVALLEVEKSFKQMRNDVIDCVYELHDGISDKPIHSNGARELLFLQSHTVHHYAFIGAMLKKQNIQVEPHFGVATATLVHEQKDQIIDEEKQICAR